MRSRSSGILQEFQSRAAPERESLSAVFHEHSNSRSTVKYRERGYRFVLFEAGMVAGQATLVAECQGIHSNQMGGFVDDDLSAVFGLDGTDEAAILPVCFGR